MKKLSLLALGLVFACNSSQKTVAEPERGQAVADPQAYAQTITQGELKELLYTYASDEFQGRETGEPGQKKAVEYLRAFYQDLGIPAAKADGDYFQQVPLELAKVPSGNVSINGRVYELGENLVAFSGAQGEYREVAYAGYGVEEGNHSDYSSLEVQGKIVLIKAGEPVDADGNYLLTGSGEPSVWGKPGESMGKKIELALEKGAAGVLYFDGTSFPRFKGQFARMKTNGSGRMNLANNGPSAPMISIDETAAKAIKKDILEDHAPKTVAVDIKFHVDSANEPVESENVVALLRGSEKPDEYVVISSHLDHVGVGADGQIFNRADDDGSGSVSMLEIAEAFKKAADAGHGPKRSILFLHVTAEEKGLLGSRYYTDVEPIVPLAQTVVDLNIDMIGRIDPNYKGERNYLYLIGADKLSSELHELSEMVNNKYTQIEFDYTYNDENDPNRFYYRSDHYNFAKNNIPIIFYFNGTHADYHRPGDTPDKIEYDLLENRSRLIFHTAWEIANRDQRLVVDKAAD